MTTSVFIERAILCNDSLLLDFVIGIECKDYVFTKQDINLAIEKKLNNSINYIISHDSIFNGDSEFIIPEFTLSGENQKIDISYILDKSVNWQKQYFLRYSDKINTNLFLYYLSITREHEIDLKNPESMLSFLLDNCIFSQPPDTLLLTDCRFKLDLLYIVQANKRAINAFIQVHPTELKKAFGLDQIIQIIYLAFEHGHIEDQRLHYYMIPYLSGKESLRSVELYIEKYGKYIDWNYIYSGGETLINKLLSNYNETAIIEYFIKNDYINQNDIKFADTLQNLLLYQDDVLIKLFVEKYKRAIVDISFDETDYVLMWTYPKYSTFLFLYKTIIEADKHYITHFAGIVDTILDSYIPVNNFRLFISYFDLQNTRPNLAFDMLDRNITLLEYYEIIFVEFTFNREKLEYGVNYSSSKSIDIYTYFKGDIKDPNYMALDRFLSNII